MATDLERQLREFFATSLPDVLAVYLYGSEARGTATPSSDVDLAVFYRQPPPTLDAMPLEMSPNSSAALDGRYKSSSPTMRRPIGAPHIA